MKLIHGTTKENAEQILVNGFDLSKAGSRGGDALGEAVYLCEAEDFWYWNEYKMYSFAEVALEVEIDDSANLWNGKISTLSDAFMEMKAREEWKPTEEVVLHGGTIYENPQGERLPINHLIARLLKSMGYDGRADDDYQVVVWNLDKIGSVRLLDRMPKGE